jgi:transcriptional regulator with XRE-family HTH domain
MTSLREARTNRLLSMRELGRLASVAASTIYLIEAGRTTPRPSIVRKLAAALEVDPRDIDEFRRAIEVSQLPSTARRRSECQPSPGDAAERRRE